MRIDVLTIFPDYLAPLSLSLPGKARERGLLDLRVHDLRDWTRDRHRTVDDTPYGGGAGMVMRPEPWGEALDAVLGVRDAVEDAASTGPVQAAAPPVLVVPTPAGRPFTQEVAAALAAEPHLVFACGRYEGIDQRVVDEASTRVRVSELSLGDYVLNGGEVAALAMIEAVVRLLPGFLGNADSLAEESHAASGLLEYPVYTRPPVWRGREVPEMLLSGDHARVAAWRHEQALRRTAERRPDLLHPSRTVSAADLSAAEWRLAGPGDAGELLTLQRACGAQEAAETGRWDLPVLRESLDRVADDLSRSRTFVLRSAGRLVGSVRARLEGEDWVVDRLMVAPDLQGRGLGRWLLDAVQAEAPTEAVRFALVTGAGNERCLRICRRAGFRPARDQGDPGLVRLWKRRRPAQP